MRKSKLLWGTLFIVIGILLLVNQFISINLLDMEYLWPLFILIPGVSMEFSYFSTRRNPGTLVPGGILTTMGLLFFFEVFTNWSFSQYTWPIYLLAVAIGLFQLYIFSGRSSGLLIPIFILTAIAVISFASMIFGEIFNWVDYNLVVPIIFIILGIYIIVRKK